MDGTASNCDDYYYVKSGDGCADIATEYGISLDDVSYSLIAAPLLFTNTPIIE
jgi:hypothetical protein